MAKYAAVTYYDDGISIFSSDDLIPLLKDLVVSLHVGQEGYTYGEILDQEAFNQAVNDIENFDSDNDIRSYEELADSIMPLIKSIDNNTYTTLLFARLSIWKKLLTFNTKYLNKMGNCNSDCLEEK